MRAFVVLFLLAPCAFAQAQQRECDRCDDLCPLVDQYWQKEKGIEIWQRYAASNPKRQQPPPEVTDVESLQNHVKAELNKALQGRTLPCKTVQEEAAERGFTPPQPPQSDIETGLETKVFVQSCEIVYGKDKLEGPVEQAWRGTHACKGSADAELAHEQVHQEICRDFWGSNRFLAVKRQSLLRNVAQSELQAWRRHRNRLRDEILKLAYNCGWEPTDRQKNDPAALPTEMQSKKMQERGWQGYEALTSRPP